MTTSASTNNCAQNHSGFGTSYAVNGQTEIQANSIDQGALTPATLQMVAVTLTAAQINGMYAAPVQLIAGTTSKSIIVDYVMIRTNPTATAFASGGVVAPQLGNTVHGGGTLLSTTLPAATIISGTASDTLLGATAANITLSQGTGVFLSNATGAFTTGTGTITVFVYYSVV